MTKPDFEVVANTLAQIRPTQTRYNIQYIQWRDIVEALIKTFSTHYPLFNEEIFQEVCHRGN